MIIDLILDRKAYESENPGVTYADYIRWAETPEGKEEIRNARKMGMVILKPYNPKDFYIAVMRYGGKFADNITYAMDYLGETMIRKALCEYIIGNDYNPEICDYINSVNWLIPA